MDAASALTNLGDSGDEAEKKPTADEEAVVQPEEQQVVGVMMDNDTKIRYIPEHKKPDAALTFPEKVRLMFELSGFRCLRLEWSCAR